MNFLHTIHSIHPHLTHCVIGPTFCFEKGGDLMGTQLDSHRGAPLELAAATLLGLSLTALTWIYAWWALR